MYISQKTKGYSLVEVLVAIAILLLALVGPMTIAAKGIQSASYVREQTTALYLAQEGIEAFTAMRNDAAIAALGVNDKTKTWDWIDTGTIFSDCDNAGDGCNIDYENNNPAMSITKCGSNGAGCELYFDSSKARARYSLDNTSGVLTPYARVIKMDKNSSGDGIKVKSTVFWETRLFGTTKQSVTLTTTLMDIYGN